MPISLHPSSLAPALAFSLFAFSILPAAAADATAAGLWEEYKKDPDRHPNIPNCSYAGYERGEKPLPKAPVIVSVKDFGAKGDGTTDDTAAFREAITKAAGKGAVMIPAGTYALSGNLVLPSKTVLRGEGTGKTTLDFKKNLTDILGPLPFEGSTQWSWTGGLIWIGPPDTFDASGKVAGFNKDHVQGWEYWRPGAEIATVSGEAKRGDTMLTLSNASSLKPGQFVLMTWENPADASLLKHISGHPSMEGYNWNGATSILPPTYPQWQWPVEIKAVKGNQVILAQPLRVDIRPEWGVAVRDPGSHVSYAGVEDLTLKMNSPREHKHLKGVGWNGIYMNRALNCWATNVEITSAENPVIFAASKNCTVDGLLINGDSQNHHSIAMRVNNHDCLVHDFKIEDMWRVKHGINIEWLSSGNVYSKGAMDKGTFDSHRALSFDLIRTDITLKNDADGPGGGGGAGPFIGARVAHWNIRVEPEGRTNPGNAPGDFVFMPLTFPMGAFVGIQGAERSDKVRDSVPGEKGSVIADTGKVPAITDLHEAQLRLRLGK